MGQDGGSSAMSTFHSCEQGRVTEGLRTEGEDWQVGTESQSQE